MPELIEVPPGLADVAVTATTIGDVIGDEGRYHYRGQSAPELARFSNFDTVAALVLDGSGEPLQGDRSLPGTVADLVGDLDLRSGLSALAAATCSGPLIEIDDPARRADAVRLIAAMPTLIASTYHGRPIEPDPDLPHVADYLRMLGGALAPDEVVAALDAYFVLTIDHGFNNSTFATRVVASTGADLGACVVAGFASLSGPRHGAALERILEMFDAIGGSPSAEAWMREEIAAGRRLQGFGHSVYRLPDPRLAVLREHGATLDADRFAVATEVEEAGTRLLAGRRLVPNVDLFGAMVLEGCGIPRGWFGATFAAARIVGWCAHAIEQASEKKIFRPAAHYIGPIPDL
ncbi:MAG: citrate/2-methylcitrate synthase [Acidimicrobiales bacterium]